MTTDEQLDEAAAIIAAKLQRLLLDLADREDPAGLYLNPGERARLEERIDAVIGPRNPRKKP